MSNDNMNVMNDQNANQSNNSDNQMKRHCATNLDIKEDKLIRCGWFCLTPDSLQNFRTPKWVLFWLCWAGALQGTIYFLFFIF